MMDLGFVVDAEAVQVQLIAKAGGSYDQTTGKWTKVTDTPLPIMATIQPATGKALRDLPEGVRDEARFILWSRQNVNLDDVIVYKGRNWRVIFEWDRDEGVFTRAALGLMKS